MKTKKILLLMIMFLFLITLLIVIPNNIFATETMSDEFKQILNEEGKFVVTDTTMLEDREQFLKTYISKYNTEDYYFVLNDYMEDTSTCWISMMQNSSGLEQEMHENILVIYEEQYSEEFKSILKNGKIELRNSSNNISEDWIESYIFSLGNEDYSFNISSYYDFEKQENKKLIKEDYSKATIIMTENNTGNSEEHIIDLVKVTEQSNNFKKYLNKDGKIEINSIKPSNEDEFWALFELLISDNDGMYASNISKDYSSFDLTVDYETHTVEVVYNYDNSVKTKLQELADKFTDNLDNFKVQDMELINYWVNTLELDAYSEFANYSGELKAYINNYNVKFKFDARAGWGAPLYTENLGIYLITYDNVVYCIKYCIGLEAEHIIYVSSDTENTKEALMEAAQKRIDEYLGKTGIATVSYNGKVKDLEDPGITGLKENDDVFKITIKVGNKTEDHYIIIKRDTSKMVNPEYSSIDIKTEVGISSTSSTIPLDTVVNSTKLTSGTEYERIMKVLDIEKGETFDLGLYSDSIKDYITELENGTFEVRLPISKDLEGKNLIVYYVDSKGNIEEHEVTVKDGFATFTTNHFSIYTLTEKVDDTATGNNPQTSDNILFFVGMLLVAVVGVTVTTKKIL